MPKKTAPKKTTKKTAPKKGRPKGAKTQPAELVDAMPSACRKCGSTNREKYWKTKVLDAAGVTHDPTPRPFNKIVLRWTRCADCGQIRIDRSHEFLPEPPRK